jgi:hypothetical protein
MSLKNMLTRIQDLTLAANNDVEGGNPATARTREGIKRQAREQLIEARIAYTEGLLGNSAFIMVNGDERDAFADIATRDFGCFTADPEALYKDLASRIPPELYLNRSSSSDAFDVLSRHLEDIANDLGIQSYPFLLWKQDYARSLTSEQELVALIKQAVNEQVGSELVGIYSVNKILDDAIAAKHSDDITPIILPTNDVSLITDLKTNLARLGTNSFIITAGKTRGKKMLEPLVTVKIPSDESVRDALVAVKSGI